MSWLLQAFPQLIAAQWLLGGALVLLTTLALRARPSIDAGTRSALWNGLLVLLCALPVLLILLAPRSEAGPPAQLRHLAEGVDAPATSFATPRSTSVGREPVPTSGGMLRPSRRHFELAFFSLWLLLVGCRLAALARDVLGLVLLRRRARPLPQREEQDIRSLLEVEASGPVPQLVEVEGLHAPAVVGPLHHRIALPPRWSETVSRSARRHALLHELAHCRRHDPLLALLRRLVTAFLPLNPAASWARSQAEIECELACDDWALLLGSGSPEDFAESLLECARAALPNASPQSATTLATALFGHQSSLHRRLVHMTTHRPRSSRLHARTLIALACLLLFAAVQGAAAWPGLPAAKAQPVETDHPRLSADSSRLFRALEDREWDRARKLVESGSDVNQIWPGDGTPLIVAARQGNADIVQLLLDLGAEPDLASAGDGTPLINAAAAGHGEIVELLLSYGADVDHHGYGGDGNPLIAASMVGDLRLVELLVGRGARIDIHVIDDDTPLINAVQQGRMDVVEYLLVQGADPNLSGDVDRRSGELRTPLNQATRFEHREIERMLRRAGAR